MSQTQDIKDLLERRDQIMIYARAGEADAFHPADSIELTRIGQKLADLGITDEDLTLEGYEASLNPVQAAGGRKHPMEFGRRDGGSFAADQDGAGQPSENKSLWDRVTGMFGGGSKAHDEAFQRRLDKIAGERTADLDGLDQG